MCPPFVEASAQQTDHKEMDDTPIVPTECDGQLDTGFFFYTSGNQEKHPCKGVIIWTWKTGIISF